MTNQLKKQPVLRLAYILCWITKMLIITYLLTGMINHFLLDKADAPSFAFSALSLVSFGLLEVANQIIANMLRSQQEPPINMLDMSEDDILRLQEAIKLWAHDDKKSAVSHLRVLADKGNHIASCLLGAYIVHDCHDKSGLALFEKAIEEKKDVNAMMTVADYYAKGVGDVIDQDITIAERYYLLAAEQQADKAYLELAYLYSGYIKGSNKNPTKVIDYLDKHHGRLKSFILKLPLFPNAVFLKPLSSLIIVRKELEKAGSKHYKEMWQRKTKDIGYQSNTSNIN